MLRESTSARVIGWGAAGCTAAASLGLIAATRHGEALAAVAVSLLALLCASAVFRRDPVHALIGLWLVALFSAPLSAMFGYFSATGEAIRQSTEPLAVLFVLLSAALALRTRTRPPPWWLVLPTVGVASFGILAALGNDVPLRVMLLGGWLGLKLWVVLLAALVVPWSAQDLRRVRRALVTVGVLVAAIGLLDFVTHGAVSRTLHTSIDPSAAGGYRANAVQSILATPGEYSLLMSLLFALSIARLVVRFNITDMLLTLLFAVSVMLSLRLKGVLSIAVVLTIVILVLAFTNPRAAVLALGAALLLAGGIYASETGVVRRQLSRYASSETSARARLYGTAERIGGEDFPFGVGFGRFASYPSRLYYSPVYARYDLNTVWGLSREYPKFIDDTSWPSVLAETGYGGLAMYVIGLLGILAALTAGLIRSAPRARWPALAGLAAIGVLAVDSVGDATLFSWMAAATFALLIAPALRNSPARAAHSERSARQTSDPAPIPESL